MQLMSSSESENLPPRGVARWVPRRKAAVVAAVHAGTIGLGEACERYKISIDEFLSWQRALQDEGVKGLRTTKRRRFRGAGEPPL